MPSPNQAWTPYDPSYPHIAEISPMDFSRRFGCLACKKIWSLDLFFAADQERIIRSFEPHEWCEVDLDQNWVSGELIQVPIALMYIPGNGL